MVVMTRWWVWIAVLVASDGCARHDASVAGAATVVLESTDGVAREFPALVTRARWTVLEFFSPSCPCQIAHDGILRRLHERYRARGVQFFAVDSEVGGSLQADEKEARTRAYPFPILLDRGAKVAGALGAEFSTYSVIVDERGDVRYRGGIDSDHIRIRKDSTPYLADALDDLLAGRAPRVAETEAYGCALQKW